MVERHFDFYEDAALLAEAESRDSSNKAEATRELIRPEAVRALLRSDLLARLDRAGAHASRELDRKITRYRDRLRQLTEASTSD